MVICFLKFGKWFLYSTILNQNASHISQTDGLDFVFCNSSVFNLKSLSKIFTINNFFSAFAGLAS